MTAATGMVLRLQLPPVNPRQRMAKPAISGYI
jgi:hypothetical protein